MNNEEKFLDLIKNSPKSLSCITALLGVNFYKAELLANKLVKEKKVSKITQGLKIKFKAVEKCDKN